LKRSQDVILSNYASYLFRKGKTTDPKLILKLYQELFLQGRPLDVITEEDVIEGETSAVYVSRHSLLTDILKKSSIWRI
jgi:hypothetical protein